MNAPIVVINTRSITYFIFTSTIILDFHNINNKIITNRGSRLKTSNPHFLIFILLFHIFQLILYFLYLHFLFSIFFIDNFIFVSIAYFYYFSFYFLTWFKFLIKIFNIIRRCLRYMYHTIYSIFYFYKQAKICNTFIFLSLFLLYPLFYIFHLFFPKDFFKTFYTSFYFFIIFI